MMMMDYSKLIVHGSKWVSIDNVWHNINNDKILCNGNYSVSYEVGIHDVDDKSKICVDCFKLLSTEDIPFNIKLFSNEMVLDMLSLLKSGNKRHRDFLHLLEGTKKMHLDYEFKKMMYNGLIVKNGRYFMLTERGYLANRLGEMIIAFREKDNGKIKCIANEIWRMIGE